MKKLVTAACALAAGLALAEVESANIVGYTTATLSQQWTILGVNFTAVDGSNIKIQDAIPYVDGMTKGAAAAAADQIQIQNASGGYDTYFMSNGKNAKGGTVANLEGKWAKGGTTTATEDTIAPGTAFWFFRQTATAPLTVKVAGGVSVLASYDKQINQAWKHIANPYPTDLPLNDGIPYVSGMTKGAAAAAADQIQIQNASGGYDTYYMSNGKNAKGGTVTGLEGKWAKMGTTTKTTDSIPAGKGAWYGRKGDTDFEITIARPYTIE